MVSESTPLSDSFKECLINLPPGSEFPLGHLNTFYMADADKVVPKSIHSITVYQCNVLLDCNTLRAERVVRLQRVQKCLARVVTKAPRFSRSVHILKRLHWLPIKVPIHFKICIETFRILKHDQTAYLADLLVRPKSSKYLHSKHKRFVEVLFYVAI